MFHKTYLMFNTLADSKARQDKLKQKALNEYKAALLMPRKKRKKLKNQLLCYII